MQMENQTYYQRKPSSKSNHCYAEPEYHSNIDRDYLSPKMIKRKPENKVRDSLKMKPEVLGQFCYIPSNKNLEHVISNYQQKNTVFSLCGSPRPRIFKELENKDLNTFSFKKVDSLRNLSTKEMIEEEEIERLMKENEKLKKKVKDFSNKISRLEEENLYCLTKIEEFTIVITSRDRQIEKISKQIQEKKRHIDQLIHLNEEKQDEVINLQQIIVDLKKIQQKNSQNNLEQEIQEYKKVNMELAEKLKYYLIQQDMYRKLIFDYQQEQSKNEKLRFMNKKLVERLSQATLEQRSRRSRLYDLSSDNSISFELSPGK